MTEVDVSRIDETVQIQFIDDDATKIELEDREARDLVEQILSLYNSGATSEDHLFDSLTHEEFIEVFEPSEITGSGT